MIETNRRDDGHILPDNIGGIQPSSQPDLKNGKRYPFSLEVAERHGGDDFEIGSRMQKVLCIGRSLLHVFKHCLQVGVGNLSVSNPDALVQSNKMRGCVK